MISRARDRGRGVRFILHAEGRAANRTSNRARVTAAEACATARVSNPPLTVQADGRAGDQRINRPLEPAAKACVVSFTSQAPSIPIVHLH
jgi:hypothetical protein